MIEARLGEAIRAAIALGFTTCRWESYGKFSTSTHREKSNMTLLRALRIAEDQGFRAISAVLPALKGRAPMLLSEYIAQQSDDSAHTWTLSQDRIWCTYYRGDRDEFWISELWFELRR